MFPSPESKEDARLRQRQTRRLHRPNPGVPGLGPRGEGQSEVAPGSGRSCANTAAVPDVALIETALADGTVVREMVCAGLSEHRTTVVYSAAEFTKGCVGVQPGLRISLPSRRVCIPGEKNDCERTRKQWTAIQTGAAD